MAAGSIDAGDGSACGSGVGAVEGAGVCVDANEGERCAAAGAPDGARGVAAWGAGSASPQPHQTHAPASSTSAAAIQHTSCLTDSPPASSASLCIGCACKVGIAPRLRSASARLSASRMNDMVGCGVVAGQLRVSAYGSFAQQPRFVDTECAVQLHQGRRSGDAIGLEPLRTLEGGHARLQSARAFLPSARRDVA